MIEKQEIDIGVLKSTGEYQEAIYELDSLAVLRAVRHWLADRHDMIMGDDCSIGLGADGVVFRTRFEIKP